MRLLSPAERDRAIDVFARAFDGDPMFRFLLPDARRHDWLRFVMGGMLAQALPDGNTYTIDGVPGVVTLVSPRGWPIPTSRLLRYIAAFWARPDLPWPEWARLRNGLRVLGLMDRLHPADPHWYVQTLGVDPDQQGQGVGRALLDGATALADADGLPSYLETTNPVNLPIYRRFGFEVADEVVLPGGFPPLWTMRRPPRPRLRPPGTAGTAQDR